MTWLSLPLTSAENKGAFFDAATATTWLAKQPQANAAAMQAELTRQITALNTYKMPARERFKTLEVLRKTLFTCDGESQRRFENRPIPLWSSEQAAQDTSRHLWRTCSVAYLHCLRACLDGDTGVADLKAKIAHRALTCLRMEQQSCYLGALDVDGDFWRTLHTTLLAAEQLEVVRVPVSDRLLTETSESTVSGQYAMALLLHLARPFELSRSQFTSAARWFARWREQAEIISVKSSHQKSHNIPLDLSLNQATHQSSDPPKTARWLALEGILRKIRKRIEALDAGQPPEDLKLGTGISRESCISLLKILTNNLCMPLSPLPLTSDDSALSNVTVGLESIHHRLGGKSLKVMDEPSAINRRDQEQIAIFGHVVRANEEKNLPKPESWRVISGNYGELHLSRLPDKSNARLNNKSLIAVQASQGKNFSLASLTSLCMHSDGSLHATVKFLPGASSTEIADISERPMGKIARYPAFIQDAGSTAGGLSIILPSGTPARALAIKLQRERPQTIKLSSCLERGSDYERWTFDYT